MYCGHIREPNIIYGVQSGAGRVVQKIQTPFRMLAHGVTTDFVNECVQIGEITAIKKFKKICCIDS